MPQQADFPGRYSTPVEPVGSKAPDLIIGAVRGLRYCIVDTADIPKYSTRRPHGHVCFHSRHNQLKDARLRHLIEYSGGTESGRSGKRSIVRLKEC
jgi:hypothetical protein